MSPHPARRPPRALLAALVVALAALVAPARAATAGPPAPGASPLLPPGHWAVQAADRLEQLGLLDRWLPAQRAVPVRAVAIALVQALVAARDRRPDLVDDIAAWIERLGREWRLGRDLPLVLGAHAGAGYRYGDVRPVDNPQNGDATFFESLARKAALALDAKPSDPVVELGAALGFGEHVAIGADVELTPWNVLLVQGEAVGGLGSWALSVGRAPAAYGFSPIGGLVLSGLGPLDRIELMTTRPLQLGGGLAALGLFTVETFLAGHFDETRHPYHPLLWGVSLQWRPHQRFTLGLNRGYMFGGDPWAGTPTGDKIASLLGVKDTGGNNVVSIAARWRLPTDALLPATVHLEWATDDNPDNLFQFPGILAGLSFPKLPALPASFAFEYGFVGRIGTGREDAPWYSHYEYQGGWADGQTPLGDPIGGNGNLIRAMVSVWDPGSQVRATVTGWAAHRFHLNLYGPGGSGWDPGVRGELVVPFGPVEATLQGRYEGIDSGHAASASALARLYL